MIARLEMTIWISVMLLKAALLILRIVGVQANIQRRKRDIMLPVGRLKGFAWVQENNQGTKQ